MKIYTMTLNPAYDIHATANHFAAGTESLATITSREAGGKGVNISRALCMNGVANTALVVIGTENAEEFKQQLQEVGMTAKYLERIGRIRENLTLHTEGQPETRISFAGFPLEDSVLQEVLETLPVDGETVVTFTGRVASGMSIQKVKEFLKELKSRGAKLVLDSKSLTAADILELQPWLIKPNQEEIADYVGHPVHDLQEAAEAAKAFSGVANVIVSMGDQGAILLTEGNTYGVKPPKIQAVSTVGAGDSMIAGFLAAAAQGEAPVQCLKRAVAYGTAACLTQGTMPPLPTAVEAIYRETEEIL